jgi:hypothetical protein
LNIAPLLLAGGAATVVYVAARSGVFGSGAAEALGAAPGDSSKAGQEADNSILADSDHDGVPDILDADPVDPKVKTRQDLLNAQVAAANAATDYANAHTPQWEAPAKTFSDYVGEVGQYLFVGTIGTTAISKLAKGFKPKPAAPAIEPTPKTTPKGPNFETPKTNPRVPFGARFAAPGASMFEFSALTPFGVATGVAGGLALGVGGVVALNRTGAMAKVAEAGQAAGGALQNVGVNPAIVKQAIFIAAPGFTAIGAGAQSLATWSTDPIEDWWNGIWGR